MRFPRPPHVFYGWRLVGITVLTMSVVSGSSFQGVGIFFVALERYFGWSRALLSGAFALSRAEGALLGPIEGFLIDHLGARRIVLIGLITLGVGLVALSFVQSIVTFYVAFLLIYAGAGLGGFLPLMTTINHWFVRRRTTAMAIGMTGFNIGGLLVPALAWAVASAGWQAASLGIGLVICALAFPIASQVRNRPAEYGLRPDGDPSPDTSAAHANTPEAMSGVAEKDDDSFTVAEALRTPAFWFITMSHGLAVASFTAVSIHIMPALTDMGMSLPMAGLVVATYTFMGVVFQLVGGFVGDRFPKPPAIAIFVGLQAAGMAIAAVMHTVPAAFLFAVLFGIGLGGRAPLLTAIRGDYFGRKNFATILGVSQLPMNIATMGTPILAGYLFDTLGSYFIAFLSLAALNFLGAIVILPARKPLRRHVAPVGKTGD
ncbi:MAG: MFS transporter [Chloroflexi bacterium]|nr:MFS transporter [Chloroflexota bacterium]